MRKLSPSQSIKTVIHAPGFYDFALQNLFHARFRAKHCVLEKINFIDGLKGDGMSLFFHPQLFRLLIIYIFAVILSKKF